jgi:hypothetical protein
MLFLAKEILVASSLLIGARVAKFIKSVQEFKIQD